MSKIITHICIKDTPYSNMKFIKGEGYYINNIKILDEYHDWFIFTNIPKENFITIAEWREIQINSILED